MASAASRFPLGQYSQRVVQAELEALEQMNGVSVDDIVEVEIQTLQKAIDIMAGNEGKWHLQTRETADHSMPYTTDLAWIYGGLHQRHFGDEFIFDPQLLDLTSWVQIEASADTDRRAP